MQDIQNISTLFTDLQNFVKTESVMGTPVNVADKTLVPVVSVTIGYGGGTNKKNPAPSKGGTVGLGARIATNAVVVINKDSVSMLPVDEKGNANNAANNNDTMNNLVNKIPEMINNFKQGGQSQNMAQNQQGNQQQNMAQNQQQNQSQNKTQNQQKQTK